MVYISVWTVVSIGYDFLLSWITGDFLRKVHLSKYIENKTYILDKGDLFTTAMYDPHGICKSTEHIT